MTQEGYIKFNFKWDRTEPLALDQILDLNMWRQKLYALGLIGITPDGFGIGNVSKRISKTQFVITGSATGGVAELGPEHYTVVTDYDFRNNSLMCKGPIQASSESLSHAAIYRNRPDVNAVFHVHHYKIWKNVLTKYPHTHESVEGGTPEMAYAIEELVVENPELKIF